MGRRYSVQVLCVAALVVFLGGCGGHTPPPVNGTPARVTLNPATSASLQQGGLLPFIATAQSGLGSTVRSTFTYASDNPTVLTVSPEGLACGGKWNSNYSICTPGGIGVANVTATALGATSPPTMVFVHAPIDNIQVSILPQLNSPPPPPACPTQVALPEQCDIPFKENNCTLNANPPYYSCACYSQNQVQQLQARAFSQGADITQSVGPFTWNENATGVVTVTPTVDQTLKFPTYEASATPGTPGQTEIFASAAGVTSQPFAFETCPVQCITMQVGTVPTQTPQTSFIATKGTAETLQATAVDVQGCIVPKPPLTWTSSQPGSIVPGSATTGCPAGTTCSASSPQAGAASITASCTPPTCNVGFPLNPLNLPQPYIPQPVYPVTAISGLATPGTTAGTFGVLATSLNCSGNPNCTVSLYNISSTKNVAGNPIPIPLPVVPNSLVFDRAGDKAYMGSQYAAALVSPGSFNSGSGAFKTLPAPATPRGAVTGMALVSSPNGDIAIFSDTISSPNQVYVVNTSSSTPVTTAYNISGAVAAAFSQDGLKALILACVPGPVACSTTPGNVFGNTLYIYSTLQAPISIPLSFPANNVVFSSSGTFALVTGGSSSAANVIGINTCDDSVSAPSPGNPALSLSGLPAEPIFLKMVPAGNVPAGNVIPSLNPNGLDFFFGIDSSGLDIIATNTALPGSPSNLFTSLCPQTVGLVPTFAPLHVPFGQGTFNPIAFFVSPDSTQAYVVPSDRSGVLVYSFSTGNTSQISLLPDPITGQEALPVSADMTPDGTLIYVATNDGILHQVSTTPPFDESPLISFPAEANSTNGFCVIGSSPVNCSLNLVAVKP
jgi:hypothetical protein